jgi:hypothetical protein
MSPAMAMERARRPPPPRPWRARNRISWSMSWLRPESAEPIRKMTMAIWNSSLRP